MEDKNIPFSKVLLEPDEYFNNPKDILDNKNYNNDEKLKLLEQWKNDIKELLTADEENMAGKNGKNISDLMEEVNKSISLIKDN